ncbi:MAG: phosphatase PAP2 family protein [Pirellulales bacterium]
MNAFRVLLATLPLLLSAPDAALSAGPTAPVSVGHTKDPVLKWNSIALQAVVDDHSGTFGAPEQGGPTRASRALAIVHIAVFDAVNAIVGGYEPYIEVTGWSPQVLGAASVETAVAQAARDTLAFLYPNQQDVFDGQLGKVLSGVAAKSGRDEGRAIGAAAAMNILLERFDDGGDAPDKPFPSGETKQIGLHQPDPLNPGQGLLTPKWGDVLPFAMGDVADFHAPPPPQPDSPDVIERLAYALAYDEVQRLGGDGEITQTERTAEQTDIGLFWGYDGSIGLGVPPRLYNQIARVIAMHEHHTTVENARLFALVNISMADAGIASWYSKYAYNYWRPVVAIRCGGSGESDDADGNEFTIGDEDWTPLGAPATNQSNGGIDFTPPFPAYTSGHATFGAALFRTLANLYGDEYEFQLISDELNGRNRDSDGRHRRAIMRQFQSFSQAARENADSRIYLGIHWSFDADEGIAIGNAVADYAFHKYLQPLP